MPDYRKLAMAAILADGTVDAAEISLLKKHLKGEDGKIDADGVQFLVELRTKLKKSESGASEEFDKYFYKVVGDNVMQEGAVNQTGAEFLRTNLFASKKVDDADYAFLSSMNKKAKTKHADFDKLYNDVEGYRAKAAGKK